MGIFSSSYKYAAYVGSSVLIPVDDRTDTVQQAVLEATQSDDSIPTSVLYGLSTDLGARAKAIIKYASKPDGYVHGLPEGTQTAINIPAAVLLDAIEDGVGEPIAEVPWKLVGILDEAFLVSAHIKAVYDDPAYFPWGIAPSDPIWDEGKEFIEIPVIDPSTGTYYITENTPVYTRVGQLTTIYHIAYVYTDNLGVSQTWKMSGILDLTPYLIGEWIFAKYVTVAAPEYISYWTYLIGSNVHPGLEASLVITTAQARYMPVVLLMQDKVWYDDGYDFDADPAPEKSPLHFTTDKLLKNYAVKGREIREDFQAQEAEGGKNEAEKWDFMIHWAISPHTRVRGAIEYIYWWLKEMAKTTAYTYEDYQTYLATEKTNKTHGYNGPQPIDEIHIKEAGDTGYNVKYGWSYIYEKTFPGRWVDYQGNELHKNRFDITKYERTKYNDAAYRIGVDEMHGTVPRIGRWNNYSDPAAEKSHENGYHDYIIVTKQHYDEDLDVWSHTRVICMGLSMRYTINTKETITGEAGYRFRYAEPHIFDFNTEESEYFTNFRIPIHIGIMNDQISRMHWEEIIGAAGTATVFLVDKTKVPWYSTGFFKWLIILIAVILIILSVIYAGGAGSETLVGVIVGLLGATGFMAFVLYVVLSFAIGFIIALAGSLIGGTAGQIFTIVGSIVMLYGAGGSNIIAGGWGAAINTINTTLAYVNLGLQIVNTYLNAAADAELRDWYKDAKEKGQELAAAYDLLGPPPIGVDALDLVDVQQRGATGEYPDAYYSRTLNMNPGMLGYALVYNFVDLALFLPERPGQENIIESQRMTFQRQIGAV